MKQARKNLVPVRRNAVLQGEYPIGELESLLETVALLQTDECFSEETSKWIPIGDFLEAAKREAGHSYKAGDTYWDEDDEERQRQIKRARMIIGEPGRRFSTLLINILIVALTLALIGGMLLWGWIRVQSDVISKEDEQIRQLQSHNDELLKGRPALRLLFSDLETADTGVVRGRVIVRGPAGKRRPKADIQLELYKRADIENFLNQQYQQVLPRALGKQPEEIMDELLDGMPSPVEITTTNVSGFYSFKIPSPGQYVIFARDSTSRQGTRVWFVSFDSSDSLNTPVDLTELNKVTVFKPDLMINEGR